MTVRDKTTLKTSFNFGDMPTESDFEDLIDSFATVGSVTEYRSTTVGPAGSDADYICDGTADDVQIQAAIDYVSALAAVMGIASMGEVEVLRGQYNIAATIDIKKDVQLRLNRGVVFNMSADVDCVNLKYGAAITGGMIYVGSGYTHAAIKLDGSSHIYLPGYASGAYMITSISNIILRSQDILGGQGIYFLADETDARGFVQGVTIKEVAIWKFETAIKLESTNLDVQPGNSVGQNHFQDVWSWFPKYGVYLTTSLWEQVNGNIFTNVHVYASADTLKCFYCEGSYNYFEPIFCWDTIAPNVSLEFAGLSSDNQASGIIGGGAFQVQRDVSNRIVDWFTEHDYGIGTGSIASGTTSDVITHGLMVTPNSARISITLIENPTNDPGNIWIDTITATEFTVHCRNDPGASNLDFTWRYHD